MKSYVDYLNGKLCGLFFKARYIDKNPKAYTEPSEAMKAGIYFEYLCTGALPKSGEIPVPDKAYAGTAREKLAAPYERAQKSAILFKRMLHHYKIKIINIGYYLHTETMDGVIDIYAEWDGFPVMIDLKYSGLIDDKWNEMGWDLDSLHMKDSLMVQGVHYKILGKECLNIEDTPFYYFVFDSGNPENAKIILQECDESRMAAHYVAVSNVRAKLAKNLQYGFRSSSSFGECMSCPLKSECPSAVKVPQINIIHY